MGFVNHFLWPGHHQPTAFRNKNVTVALVVYIIIGECEDIITTVSSRVYSIYLIYGEVKWSCGRAQPSKIEHPASRIARGNFL